MLLNFFQKFFAVVYKKDRSQNYDADIITATVCMMNVILSGRRDVKTQKSRSKYKIKHDLYYIAEELKP